MAYTDYHHTLILSPHPLLSAYVEHFVILRPLQHFEKKVPWHIMPDLSSHLIFHVYQGKKGLQSQLNVIGPRSIFVEANLRKRRFTLFMKFTPLGASAFFPLPMGELRNESVDLMEFWGEEAFYLRESLKLKALENNASGCTQLIEQVLLKKLSQIHPLHATVNEAIRLINAQPILLSIKELAGKLGISERYLRKLMLQKTGLSPKRFARIARITQAIKMADQQWNAGWAALAVDHGYYDQAHMIDDFQELVGDSPERFIQRHNRETVL